MEVKDAVFQKLKPACVALSQAALALNGPQGYREQVGHALETLKAVLSSVTSRPNTLDPKLADYAFFPVSQILKVSQKVSIRALELCLQCVAILIDQGWRDKIAPQLAAQLLILCTLLAEKHPKGLAFGQTTDELRASAFWCLHRLFSALSLGSNAQRVLASDANIPQLGQSISVILDGIDDDSSIDVQMPACHALETLISNCLEEQTQADFLPGIVSKLTRVLTPQTKLRRNPKVLIKCLDILRALLQNTLNDTHLSGTSSKDLQDVTPNKKPKMEHTINAKWLDQAAIQLKPALNNVFKLRSHSRYDVQDALGRLCVALLTACRKTLANCSYLALDTLLIMSAERSDHERLTDLDMLVTTDPFITDLLQTITYDWLQSMITIMQGSDEQRKLTKIRQIRRSYELLKKAMVNISTIDHVLASTLRDSVVATLTLPGTGSEESTVAAPLQSLDLSLSHARKEAVGFRSPLVALRGQEDTMDAMKQLVELISSSSNALDFPRDLARNFRQSSGPGLVASFWMLLTATQYSLEHQDSIADLLYIEDHDRDAYREHLEELYSYSLEILSDTPHESIDSRLQALALRSLALRATIAGPEFRYELVDALYPVLHLLATPNESLQKDSMTTLNAFTSACAYKSVRDMIVENVDYLTSAVALKLNTFDVSPQAPQVLLMMVRLAGPSLLPYLEDTVASIFAALEDYHGYPVLVELLFKVLGVMAEEGAKSPQLAIEDGSRPAYNHLLHERWQPTTILGLATLLKNDEMDRNEDHVSISEPHEPHPKRPWKDADETGDAVGADDNDLEQQNEADAEHLDDVDLPPPAPKVYNLLFKITELTQHFLPSASPSLRISLLALIRTTVPALAKHENSFLPLINTLWPEVVSRIDDSEPYVVAAALDIVQVLCEYAGEFMRTRWTQLWPRLTEIHHELVRDIVHANLHLPRHPTTSGQGDMRLVPSDAQVRQAVSRMRATPGMYGDTSSRLVWNALVACVTTAVRVVRVSPEIFDEALAMMEPVIGEDEVAAPFVEENSDAVWLCRLRSGMISQLHRPPGPESSRWHFSEVHV